MEKTKSGFFVYLFHIYKLKKASWRGGGQKGEIGEIKSGKGKIFFFFPVFVFSCFLK